MADKHMQVVADMRAFYEAELRRFSETVREVASTTKTKTTDRKSLAGHDRGGSDGSSTGDGGSGMPSTEIDRLRAEILELQAARVRWDADRKKLENDMLALNAENHALHTEAEQWKTKCDVTADTVARLTDGQQLDQNRLGTVERELFIACKTVERIEHDKQQYERRIYGMVRYRCRRWTQQNEASCDVFVFSGYCWRGDWPGRVGFSPKS